MMYVYPSITFDYLQFGLFLYAFGYDHDKYVVLSASARNAKPQSSALSIAGIYTSFFVFNGLACGVNQHVQLHSITIFSFQGLASKQIHTYKRIL